MRKAITTVGKQKADSKVDRCSTTHASRKYIQNVELCTFKESLSQTLGQPYELSSIQLC